MKVYETVYEPAATNPEFLETLPGRCLFFDIETTGFSARFCQVYLIGATWREKDGWHFIQWFADTEESEREVLKAFSSFLMSFDTVVHYNGDTFDIPFLKGRFQVHGMSDPFPLFEDVDLMKLCRPLKKLLPLGSLRLKALESFLGIHRDDLYNGGELIEVYRDYLARPTPRTEHDLMLHNEEDVRGMPELLPIFRYLSLPEASFRLMGQSLSSYRGLDGSEKEEVFLTFQSSVCVPQPFTSTREDARVHMDGDVLTIRMEASRRCLKCFFPDPKNYLYLTMEEKVVHKSVGQFVDPAFRRKALPEECFAEQEGIFLPQKKPVIQPVFQEERKGKKLSFEYRDPLEWTDEQATSFVRSYLQ